MNPDNEIGGGSSLPPINECVCQPLDFTPKDLFNLREHVDNAYHAEKVKHGHWVPKYDTAGITTSFHCSLCDPYLQGLGVTRVSNFCPDCGARMDEYEIDGDVGVVPDRY